MGGSMKKMGVPSGKHTKNYGKSPFFMGKTTISMAMFNSELLNYQRVYPNSWMVDLP
jgi:hypothetical protein